MVKAFTYDQNKSFKEGWDKALRGARDAQQDLSVEGREEVAAMNVARGLAPTNEPIPVNDRDLDEIVMSFLFSFFLLCVLFILRILYS
ncbi:unnamed protein product [Ilex paraguariensis]|uniref:Uncharacterized protein n=1 Tax=Ilex paraguariensis TaxID=185542 RepID=A0ABC8SR86_9AQUA